MERRQLSEIPCLPENRRASECSHYPACRLSKHHILPRRLAHIAIEADAGDEYVEKLKRAIKHPATHLMACRMVHDYLDTVTSDELPSEEYLERYQ